MRWFNKIRKNPQPKFFIHEAYQERPANEYFHDVLMEKENIIYQPDIYPLAAFLGDKFGCDCIIDVGCGTANKLVKLHPDLKKMVRIDNK